MERVGIYEAKSRLSELIERPCARRSSPAPRTLPAFCRA